MTSLLIKCEEDECDGIKLKGLRWCQVCNHRKCSKFFIPPYQTFKEDPPFDKEGYLKAKETLLDG